MPATSLDVLNHLLHRFLSLPNLIKPPPSLMSTALPAYESSRVEASSYATCKSTIDRSRNVSSPRRRPSALLCRALPRSWAPRPLPKVSVPRIKIHDGVTARQCTGIPLSHALSKKSSEETRSGRTRGRGVTDACLRDLSLANDEDDLFDTSLVRVHDGNGGKAYLYPCRPILLATHFASVGSIDPLQPQPEATQHLIDITLPHSEMFFIIRDYVYSQSIDQLMKSLLPLDDARLPADGRSASVDATAQAFATALTGPELISRSYLVYATFQNASHLGLNDATFWQSLNVAWAVITRSLQLWRATEL